MPTRSRPSSALPPVRDAWLAQMPSAVGPLQKAVALVWERDEPLSRRQSFLSLHEHINYSPNGDTCASDLVDWLILSVDRGAHLCLNIAKDQDRPATYTSSIDTVSRSIDALVSVAPLAFLSRELYRRYLEWFVGDTSANTLEVDTCEDPSLMTHGLSAQVALLSAAAGLNIVHRTMAKAVKAYADCCLSAPSVRPPLPAPLGQMLDFLDAVAANGIRMRMTVLATAEDRAIIERAYLVQPVGQSAPPEAHAPSRRRSL